MTNPQFSPHICRHQPLSHGQEGPAPRVHVHPLTACSPWSCGCSSSRGDHANPYSSYCIHWWEGTPAGHPHTTEVWYPTSCIPQSQAMHSVPAVEGVSWMGKLWHLVLTEVVMCQIGFSLLLFPFIPRPLPAPLQIFILFVDIFSDQLVLCFKIVFVSPWLPFYPAGDCHPL